MEENKEKLDPGTAFTSESSCWTLGEPPDGNSVSYLFSGDKESCILSDFGWNQPENSSYFFAYERSDLAGNVSCGLPENTSRSSGLRGGSVKPLGYSDVSTSNPSVSSSSSEDPTEKSTVSCGKPPEIPSKTRKKGQKRIRQPRFAFMTKSEVDHLEDGYRWRKYGQKAVKNSAYPRNYYRCTNSICTVKKRVERSSEDPAIVITTYEGQHCHHAVGFPRGGLIHHEASLAGHLNNAIPPYYYPVVQMPRETPSITQFHQQFPVEPRESQPRVLSGPTPPLPTDEGLLGDIVPPVMRNR